MSNYNNENSGGLIASCIYLVIFAAWITHIVVCISAKAWGLLVAGAIVFPIGIIHGFGEWLGFWAI